MKIKTSVSISKKCHTTIQRIAKAEDRSVSYVLEKFIEVRCAQLHNKRKLYGIVSGGARVGKSSGYFGKGHVYPGAIA